MRTVDDYAYFEFEDEDSDEIEFETDIDMSMPPVEKNPWRFTIYWRHFDMVLVAWLYWMLDFETANFWTKVNGPNVYGLTTTPWDGTLQKLRLKPNATINDLRTWMWMPWGLVSHGLPMFINKSHDAA